jgi:DNA polymerase III subunit delta
VAKADEKVFDAYAVMDDHQHPTISPCVVAVGSDDFVRDQAISISIKAWKIDPASIMSHYGDEVGWVDIHDQLATRSLFDEGGHKTVIVRAADKFVSKHREQLEKWAASTAIDATLILHLDSLASNTRLFKQVVKTGTLINCAIPTLKSFGSPPDDKAIEKWIVSWGHKRHHIKLTSVQARVLVERIGPIFGLLDCELAKLALFAKPNQTVDSTYVDQLVGGWRTKSAWDVADWIAEGQIAQAIAELDRLFAAGQSPVGLMAQIGWSLRRFGLAANIFQQAKNVGPELRVTDALAQAGFFANKLASAEQQLRRMGLRRAMQIPQWLVELDLKLKGTHSHDDRARFAIEEFVMRF